MKINTKYRTNLPEIMDDFALEGETLRVALDKIASINQFLGGNKLTLQGVQKILSSVSKTNEIVLIDIGCGNGDMLRTLAEYGKINNWKFKLVGIDANNFTINYAKNLSSNYDNISYHRQDVFDKPFEELNYDIVLCTLTLHHFNEDEILKLMNVFYKKCKLGIVINDLHRNSVAYRLFQGLCVVFGLNKMSKEDGLISILRGFKKQDFIDFSTKLDFKKYTLNWKWAFRYQWIILK